MEKEKIYAQAKEFLKGMEDTLMSDLTVGEALFLFRYCLRLSKGGMCTTAAFGEDELMELSKIALAVHRRSDTSKTVQ